MYEKMHKLLSTSVGQLILSAFESGIGIPDSDLGFRSSEAGQPQSGNGSVAMRTGRRCPQLIVTFRSRRLAQKPK